VPLTRREVRHKNAFRAMRLITDLWSCHSFQSQSYFPDAHNEGDAKIWRGSGCSRRWGANGGDWGRWRFHGDGARKSRSAPPKAPPSWEVPVATIALKQGAKRASSRKKRLEPGRWMPTKRVGRMNIQRRRCLRPQWAGSTANTQGVPYPLKEHSIFGVT